MNLYFNLFKVKFVKLDELMEENGIKLKRGSNVNVFINMENVIMKLCNPKVDEYLRVSGKNKHIELISEILNLASHYRLYFTKNGIHSKVYLYMQYPFKGTQKNSIFNKEYRRYYSYKFDNDISYFSLSEALNTAIPLTKMIVEYIEGVYFIESANVENSLVPSIIGTDAADANFIVSSGIYDFQYVNHNCNIIVSKQNDSRILTKDNVMDYIKITNDVLCNTEIGSVFIPFILSIIGSKHRNIYSLKGFGIKKVFKLIEKALSTGLITNNMNNINLLLAVVKDGYKDLILNNFYCTDINSQMLQLNTKDTHDILSQCIDKFDNVSLRKINDEFFANTPINLIELTSQVADKKIKPKVIFK